jgi:hypothetical protein
VRHVIPHFHAQRQVATENEVRPDAEIPSDLQAVAGAGQAGNDGGSCSADLQFKVSGLFGLAGNNSPGP